MKDYSRAVIVVNYKSGNSVAFWTYRFSYSPQSVSWHAAANPYDEKESNALRERLALMRIALLEDPVKLATDIVDIESVWVAERYLGEEGEIPEDE